MAQKRVSSGGRQGFRLPPVVALRRRLSHLGHQAGSLGRFVRRWRESEERYRLASRGANDGLWDWDIESDHAFFSERWKMMLGYEEREIGNRAEDWLSLIHPDDIDSVRTSLQMHLEGETPHFESEYRARCQDGSYRWMLSRGLAVRDGGGRPLRMAGSQTDITERKLAVEELLRNAFHDTLTGLPNRLLFMDRLQNAAKRARRRGSDFQFAVLFIDIDRFKTVNDTFGHATGDALLVEIGRRLDGSLRPGDTVARIGDTVARMGGDEFTILLEGIVDANDALRVARRMLDEIAVPFVIGGHEVIAGASIGVALSSARWTSPEDLLRDADAAMYRAKRLGKGRVEICDAELHDRSLRELRLEGDLRHALERNELRLVYQPVISLETKKLAGFEALLRWNHPELGTVSPGDFIGVAEESGLIRSIGEWVLRQASLQLREWNERLPGLQLTMSVNVSGRQLGYGDFHERLLSILAETGVQPAALRLEITESAMIRNLEMIASQLALLQRTKVRIAIDDFGTGYSSFTLLSRFAIDTLKIDRSFVSRIEDDDESRKMVRAMVPIADLLGMEAVAEGIETTQQREELEALRCGYGQGYLFSKPVEAHEATDIIAGDRVW